MSYKKIADEGSDVVAGFIFATMDAIGAIFKYTFLFPFWCIGLCKRLKERLF